MYWVFRERNTFSTIWKVDLRPLWCCINSYHQTIRSVVKVALLSGGRPRERGAVGVEEDEEWWGGLPPPPATRNMGSVVGSSVGSGAKLRPQLAHFSITEHFYDRINQYFHCTCLETVVRKIKWLKVKICKHAPISPYAEDNSIKQNRLRFHNGACMEQGWGAKTEAGVEVPVPLLAVTLTIGAHDVVTIRRRSSYIGWWKYEILDINYNYNLNHNREHTYNEICTAPAALRTVVHYIVIYRVFQKV